MVSNPIKNFSFFEPVKELIPLVDEKMREQSDGSHTYLQEALTHLLDSGGKRIRSALTLLISQMFYIEQEKMIILAAAVEMLHTATLVHDDLIDGAMLRRGNPTLTSKWSPGAAILTGDYLFARAAKLSSETGSLEIMNMFANKLSIIVNGEVTQLFSKRGRSSMEEYFQKIYSKTASLFELACIAPVYMNNKNKEDIVYLGDFGINIGMAFQIVDDILDYTGDQARVGKPIVSDLRQGLVTLPALFYLEEHPNDPRFEKYVIQGEDDNNDMEGLIEDILKSGAVEKAIEKAIEFTETGLKSLDHFENCAEKDALIELARSNINRDF
jgi:geranylgeranyl pyrophosphate synthase